MRDGGFEPGEFAAEDALVGAFDDLLHGRLRQSFEDIADVVATLEAGERVRVVEDAPGWPLHTIVGTVVAWPDGTLILDTWPWPVRLPSGRPGLSVVGIEVLS